MATKSKRRKRRAAAPGLRQQAERALSKREFKQALKQAKVCYRQQPSDEHHRLLERAYLARADDLLRSGMRDAGRSALEALLELGVTEPAVRRELPPLLVAVGLLDRGLADGAESAAEADPRLLTAAADHAVVRPADAPASLPGIREGAAAVRAALEALGKDDETAAVGRLKGIGRNSPFADWKLLVRGLAAYYRDDASEMQANWDRLDADRLPARIARSLRALADPASADRNDPQVKRGLGQLTSETLGGPVLSDLYDLRDHLAAGRWKNAVASLGKSLPALRRLDATLAERLVAILYDQTVYHGDASRFVDLRSCADPLPIDPHWNRAEALLAEHPKNDDEGQAEAHWLRYLDDLDGVECFAPAERNLAKALIWERLGEMLAAQSVPAPPSLRPFVGDTEGGQDRAIQCFENCLRLAPDYLAGYQSLAQAQLDWDQSEEAAETYRRLLERFPDDVDALKFLARHYQKRDDCFAALEYARKAHRLKPANPEIIELVWASHVGTARHHALRKEWERGRQAFAAADRVKPSAQDAYYLLARKALFELKARNFDLGEELVERAKGQNGEPTPALLVLAIESTRYDLSRTARSGFQRQWKAALKNRKEAPS
ncbi:MAG: tetratricopeptide repeat protein [Pirellulales bacterium]